MPRRRRGSPSVFNLSRQAYNPRAASPSASSRPSFTETAPQTSVLGPGMEQTLTPDVQSYAPEGAGIGGPGFDLGGAQGPGAMQPNESGTQLIDALMQEEQPPAPFGGTSGNPEADQALMGAESMYGTPGAETPLAAATQSSMLGSSPGASLSDIVPGYGDSTATYNRNKLIRMMLEGY